MPQLADWVDDDAGDDALLTGEAVELSLHPLPFGLRAAGALIDVVAMTILYVATIIGLFTLADSLGAEDAWFAVIGIGALVLAYVIAPMVVETVARGRSLGKLAVGGRIVRDDGGAISLRHALVRSLVGVVELRMTLGGLAALVGIFHPRSKRLGDVLAGTYCQNERISGRTAPIFGAPDALRGWMPVADVARMPDHLARRIGQFLAGARELESGRRDVIARSLADEAARYVSPLPAVDAELFLAGIAVKRREREAIALELERRRLAVLEPALTGVPHGFPRRDSPPAGPTAGQ